MQIRWEHLEVSMTMSLTLNPNCRVRTSCFSTASHESSQEQALQYKAFSQSPSI